jgi:coenzyme F420-reducing hydrogenase gamma subunit
MIITYKDQELILDHARDIAARDTSGKGCPVAPNAMLQAVMSYLRRREILHEDVYIMTLGKNEELIHGEKLPDNEVKE